MDPKMKPAQKKPDDQHKDKPEGDSGATQALAILGGLGLVAHIAEAGEKVDTATQGTEGADQPLALRPQDRINPLKANRLKA